MEQKLARRISLLEYEPKQSICFISKGRLENIPMKSIVHIEKFGMETRIYTSVREYITFHSLQELLQELPVNDFARVHRSHIVSLGNVIKVERCHLAVNYKRIPVSDYYRELLKKKLGRILEQRYRWFSSK
jgi:DNA-binding LytR/AlgR family response regulator